MKKDLRIGLIIIGVVIVAGLLAVVKNQQASAPQSILFYSNYCPHCKIVEEYINNNNIKNKITFQELEVADNEANSRILFNKAKICKLDTKTLGVPLFFDGKTCLMGDENIIKYFDTIK